MRILLEAVFVGSLLLVAWTYAGYPLAMAIAARLFARPHRCDPALRPSLSVIVPARDEAGVIARKVRSVLSQGWPSALLELIVVDDGSRDGTAEEAARAAAASGSEAPVKVLALAAPSGKAIALNAGVAAARGEILVLTDARQPLQPGALFSLTVPFGDPGVGAVSGELSLRPGGGGLGLYRLLDDRLRRDEARTGSSVGVTGALWALRRDLYAPMPPGLVLDDLHLPLCVARAGRRVVVAPGARVTDVASPEPARELRRRTRTLAGNLQLLRALPWLLSPSRNPLFFRLLQHKLLRLAAPAALLLLLASSLALLLSPPLAPSLVSPELVGYAVAGQVLLYGLAAVPAPPSSRGLAGGVLRACRAFVFLHVAAAIALWRFARGEERSLWRDGRGVETATPGAATAGLRAGELPA